MRKESKKQVAQITNRKKKRENSENGNEEGEGKGEEGRGSDGEAEKKMHLLMIKYCVQLLRVTVVCEQDSSGNIMIILISSQYTILMCIEVRVHNTDSTVVKVEANCNTSFVTLEWCVRSVSESIGLFAIIIIILFIYLPSCP